MLSAELKEYAGRVWEAALESLGSPARPLAARMDEIEADERALLQLAYGELPLQDAGAVPFETMRSFARHALALRRESPFCRSVPEDIFLHFVFCPRVNSEDLTDCRPFFFDRLLPRVHSLSAEQAILEVNRWCAENMTYRASDDRTQNPMTSYNCGLGRCGEESTFAVTALRSVGIPARQIYAPLWAHCDDNHAWVEAFAGGTWYFIGGCEAEPILNRSWFIDAASRAPLECWRTFFTFRGQAMSSDELVGRDGAALLYNVTDRYAPVSRLTVRALAADGSPLPGAKIRAEIVNMAAARLLCQNRADGRGEYSARLGRGSYHLEADAGDLHAETDVLLQDEPLRVTLTLHGAEKAGRTWDADCLAPLAAPVNRAALTREQQEKNREALDRCAAARQARLDSYWRPEYALFGPELERICRAAGKNAAELYGFYAAQEEADRPLALALLRSLAPKDWRDVSRAVLEDSFAARTDAGKIDVENVLCPRIGYEMLEPWRKAVRAAFPGGSACAQNPPALMDEIRARFPDGTGRYYPPLWLTPLAILRCGHADDTGRRVLFVAAMRAFGQPARLNPADGAAEYRENGVWRAVGRAAGTEGLIVLTPQKDAHFVYGTNYTLSRRESGGWKPLVFEGAPLRVSLPAGRCRLTTASRLPNGNQLCRLRDFSLEAGQTLVVPLELRAAAAEQMLSCNPLQSFALRGPDGREIPAGELIKGKTALIWLDPGKEPTEHILNELLAAADELRGAALRPVFVLQSETAPEDPTLRKVLAALPGIRTVYDDFDAVPTMLARKMFLEPGVWPLLVLTDETLRGYYANAGYCVGLVELTIQLSKL